MIENLEEIGLSKEFISKMINTLGYDTTLNLASNYIIIKSNIELLKECNINNIEEIILYNPDVMLLETKTILNKLKNINLLSFSNLVNEDITVIDEILE